MRKLFYHLVGAVLLTALFSLQGLAQGNSGKAPEFVLFKHYQGAPITQVGDSLGTIYFKAMGGVIPPWRISTSIQTLFEGPNGNPNQIPGTLVFRTGVDAQHNRMAVTSEGLVGIGTLLPQFNLHTVGNTHTTGDFYGRIHFDDNQGTDEAPNTYIDESYFELKQRNVLGLPAGPGTHGGLLSLAPGATSLDHQLFFAEDGIFTRRWDGNANSWAGSTWFKMLTGEDIMGTPNRIAKFTGPSQLGDSQLWDDGARVGIGTTSPAAAFFLDVNGDTRLNGNAEVSTSLNVGGAATIATNASIGGNAQVTGNAAVGGNASVSGDLDVSSDAHVDGRVTIGTSSTPGALGPVSTAAYHLFVEGGILTEEVLVRSGWADYVFEPGYVLPPLEEVATFIERNGHLPGTPAAAEIEANGLPLAENAVRQQEKIEEIFLYLIELKKEVQTLQTENQALRERLNALESQR